MPSGHQKFQLAHRPIAGATPHERKWTYRVSRLCLESLCAVTSRPEAAPLVPQFCYTYTYVNIYSLHGRLLQILLKAREAR